jgi:hypothetical protein
MKKDLPAISRANEAEAALRTQALNGAAHRDSSFLT